MSSEITGTVMNTVGFDVIRNDHRNRIMSYCREHQVNSLALLGLYLHMASKPDGWKFSYRRLTLEIPGTGEKAIRGLLRHLEALGYYTVRNRQGEDGRFRGEATFDAGNTWPAQSDQPLTETVRQLPPPGPPPPGPPPHLSSTGVSNTDNQTPPTPPQPEPETEPQPQAANETRGVVRTNRIKPKPKPRSEDAVRIGDAVPLGDVLTELFQRDGDVERLQRRCQQLAADWNPKRTGITADHLYRIATETIPADPHRAVTLMRHIGNQTDIAAPDVVNPLGLLRYRLGRELQVKVIAS